MAVEPPGTVIYAPEDAARKAAVVASGMPEPAVEDQHAAGGRFDREFSRAPLAQRVVSVRVILAPNACDRRQGSRVPPPRSLPAPGGSHAPPGAPIDSPERRVISPRLRPRCHRLSRLWWAPAPHRRHCKIPMEHCKIDWITGILRANSVLRIEVPPRHRLEGPANAQQAALFFTA